jgi:SAM-dependent methyltransferase
MRVLVLFKNLIDRLRDPRLEKIDFDSDELLKIQQNILQEKKMMRGVFEQFYRRCMALDTRYLSGVGQRFEIGAGVSFFNKLFPEVLITDIKKSEHLDRVLDAQQMGLPDNSVRAIFGINCFHHLPEPEKFFLELERVLTRGGGCILIEPYYGPMAKWTYTQLFKTETFDESQPAWNTKSAGVMVGANQALSYLVFFRDRDKFCGNFPDLEIVYSHTLNNYLQYLFSGGLNFRPLLPEFLTPAIKGIEFLFTPLAPLFALHHIIVLRKKN